MAARRSERSPSSTWVAIVAVAILATVVGVLSYSAYTRGSSGGAIGLAAPVPSFTLGVETGTPAPTATVNDFPRETERFLSIGASAMWRATAGVCGGASPTVERSTDDGVTWRDVTPGYLGISQIAALDAFQGTEAEIVAGLIGQCAPAALRTYTQGQFWESYPAVLAASRYIDLGDPSVVHLAGTPVSTPCDAPHGLRAAGQRVALVCEGTAYGFNGSEWSPFPEQNVLGVAVSATAVYTAVAASRCEGVEILVHREVSTSATASMGCLRGTSSGLVAISVYGDTAYMWSGDAVMRIATP